MNLGLSPLTGDIYSGTVKGDMWVGKKTDVTSDFLRCVLEKAKYHGGKFEVRGGSKLFVVTVVEVSALKEQT
jgi:hypothetical protein